MLFSSWNKLDFMIIVIIDTLELSVNGKFR